MAVAAPPSKLAATKRGCPANPNGDSRKINTTNDLGAFQGSHGSRIYLLNPDQQPEENIGTHLFQVSASTHTLKPASTRRYTASYRCKIQHQPLSAANNNYTDSYSKSPVYLSQKCLPTCYPPRTSMWPCLLMSPTRRLGLRAWSITVRFCSPRWRRPSETVHG